ncbi:oligosaccharide repeat unit polymerase [Priestia flexa]|uniref:O-antigen polymerase n=1 Tax=Priestia flexa TaxID=86664 RepID=UPI001F2D0093|nr:O-antigen polymerase [Priestia flexa]UIR30977.1 oligosaccharide repeat unit polymerase [Priestia flexa]
MDFVEVFNGALRFNKYLIILNIMVIIHFCLSYYFLCIKRGFKVDFWHLNIFISFLLPYIIIYPFSASLKNLDTIGNVFLLVRDNVDKAYIITLIGYIFVYLGLYYHDFSYRKTIMYSIVEKTNNITSELIYFSLKNKYFLKILYIVSIFLMTYISLKVISSYGFSFNFRSYVMGDTSLRPLFNFVMVSMVPFVVTFMIIRYLDVKKNNMLLSLLVLIFFLFFSGSRTSIVWPILNALFIYFIAKKLELRLLKLIIFGGFSLLLILYLGDLRAGNYSFLNSISTFSSKILYGNNFSDIRDFAWILTYWDENYINGKSYLAAFFAFVPRSISELREIWSISVYTSNMVGLDPDIHAGLRPGKFGEAFFNFGYIGVAAIGFITGYVLRYTDVKIKTIINRQRDINYTLLYSNTILYTLISMFHITSSFWRFYIIVFILLTGYILFKISTGKLFKNKSFSGL